MKFNKLAKILARTNEVTPVFDALEQEIQNEESLSSETKLVLQVLLRNYAKKPSRHLERTLTGMLEDLSVKTWAELGYSSSFPNLDDSREYLIGLILTLTSDGLDALQDDVDALVIEFQDNPAAYVADDVIIEEIVEEV